MKSSKPSVTRGGNSTIRNDKKNSENVNERRMRNFEPSDENDDDWRGATDMSSFEHAKENIIPLQKGRSAKTLARLYAAEVRSSAKSPERELQKSEPSSLDLPPDAVELLSPSRVRSEIQALQRQIAETTELDNDPLAPHARLLKVYETFFPSGDQKQYRSALERATRTFCKDERYRNDLRYVNMWLAVAKHAPAPLDVFSYLRANNIGSKTSSFYEEYAALLEKLQRFKEADEVFCLGLKQKASPLESLKKKYLLFQRRRAVAEAIETEDKASEEQMPAKSMKEPMGAVRTILGAKFVTKASTKLTSSSEPGGSQAVDVYRDKPGEQLTFAAKEYGYKWDDFGTERSRTKENFIEPEKWTGSTLIQRHSDIKKVKTESFTVYMDETSQPLDSNWNNLAGVLQPKCVTSLRDESDSVGAAPTAKVRQETTSKPIPESDGNMSTQKPTMVSISERLVCDLSLLIVGDEEFCFEELRAKSIMSKSAQDHFQVTSPSTDITSRPAGTPTYPLYPIVDENSPFNSPKPGASNRRTTCEASETESPCSGRPAPAGTLAHAALTNSGTGFNAAPLANNPKQIASSPTFNTKAALADVMDMFNEPEQPSDDDENWPQRIPGTSVVAQSSDGWGTVEVESGETISSKVFKPHVESIEGKIFVDDEDCIGKLPIMTGVSRVNQKSAERLPLALKSIKRDIPNTASLALAKPIVVVDKENEPFSECSASASYSYRPTDKENEEVQPQPMIVGHQHLENIRKDENEYVPRDCQFIAQSTSTTRIPQPRSTPAGRHIGSAMTQINFMTPIAEVSFDGASMFGDHTGASMALSTVSTAKFHSGLVAMNTGKQLNSTTGFENSPPQNPASLRHLEKNGSSVGAPVGNVASSAQSHLFHSAISGETPTAACELLESNYPPNQFAKMKAAGDKPSGGMFQDGHDDDDLEPDDLDMTSGASNYFLLTVDFSGSPWPFYVLKTLRGRLMDDQHLVMLPNPISCHILHPNTATMLFSAEIGPSGTITSLREIVAASSKHPFGRSLSRRLEADAARGVDDLLAAFWAIELMRAVESLHVGGVLHLAIGPDCVYLRRDNVGSKHWLHRYNRGGDGGWSSRGIWLGGFDRSIDLLSIAGDQGNKNGVLYEADWAAVACTIHFLLVGTPIQTTTSNEGLAVVSLSAAPHWNSNPTQKRNAEMWDRLLSTLFTLSSTNDDHSGDAEAGPFEMTLGEAYGQKFQELAEEFPGILSLHWREEPQSVASNRRNGNTAIFLLEYTQ
ncbi:hypothetical protein DFJ73DRAFT_760813 [Zopfochytrium polystomum]|nr:hypothetical protein DFJ73DRAFT_760813 [Zopfochytrium polystomum]